MKRILTTLAICTALTAPTWAQQAYHDQDTNADYFSDREEFLALVGEDAKKHNMTPEFYTAFMGNFAIQINERCFGPDADISNLGQVEIRALSAIEIARNNKIGKGDIGQLIGLAQIALLAGSDGQSCEELQAEFKEIFAIVD